MSNSFGMHLIGQTMNGCEFDGGGNAIVRCVWGLWSPRGDAVDGTVGIGARVSGCDIWACAASAARETKEMLADWGRRERRPSQLLLFESVGGGA